MESRSDRVPHTLPRWTFQCPGKKGSAAKGYTKFLFPGEGNMLPPSLRLITFPSLLNFYFPSALYYRPRNSLEPRRATDLQSCILYHCTIAFSKAKYLRSRVCVTAGQPGELVSFEPARPRIAVYCLTEMVPPPFLIITQRAHFPARSIGCMNADARAALEVKHEICHSQCYQGLPEAHRVNWSFLYSAYQLRDFTEFSWLFVRSYFLRFLLFRHLIFFFLLRNNIVRLDVLHSIDRFANVRW